MPELEYIYVSLTADEAANLDTFKKAFRRVARANGATKVVSRRKPGGVMIIGVDLCDVLPSALPDIARLMFRRMMNR